jgi:hypothetical protein
MLYTLLYFDWLIDWCLSPILVVFQLYRGVQYICTLITTRNIQAVINKLELQLCIVIENMVLKTFLIIGIHTELKLLSKTNIFSAYQAV